MKHIVARTYKPLLVKYLSKTRVYHYHDLSLEIPPEVFHPGFFSSSHLLLQNINREPLTGKRLLELGAGSGLIAMDAAKKGATVTATDINPVAIAYLHKNTIQNNVKVEIIRSDLFARIPQQLFDIIAINPPYFKKAPQTPKEHAWYCGEKGEFFENMFREMGPFIHPGTVILMGLCNDCDLEMIGKYAANNQFSMTCLCIKKNWIETNFIYQIKKIERT